MLSPNQVLYYSVIQGSQQPRTRRQSKKKVRFQEPKEQKIEEKEEEKVEEKIEEKQEKEEEKEEQNEEKKEEYSLTLYSPTFNTTGRSFSQESGAKYLQKKLQNKESPEIISCFTQLWSALFQHHVSFRYMTFRRGEIIFGNPSSNVQSLGQNFPNTLLVPWSLQKWSGTSFRYYPLLSLGFS